MRAVLAFAFLMSSAAVASQMVITAEKVTCEKNKNTCVAENNVKVVQESKDQQEQTLTADHLTVVFYEKSEEGKNVSKDLNDFSNPLGSSEIKEVHAKGNVVVIRGNVIIRADRAAYARATDMVTFHDRVHIKDGQKAYIKSSFALMNQKTGTYEVNNKGAELSRKVQIIVNEP